jgi:hypothetical protein
MSEPRGQTFMLHERPSPLCEAEWVKLTPHWLCDDPTKRKFVGLLVWLTCVHTQVHMPSCDMKTSPCWQCALSAQGRGIRSWTLVAGILFCSWEANCWNILVLLDFLIFVFQISQVLIICIDRTRWDGGITGRESPGWGGFWFRTLVLCRYELLLGGSVMFDLMYWVQVFIPYFTSWWKTKSSVIGSSFSTFLTILIQFLFIMNHKARAKDNLDKTYIWVSVDERLKPT